MEADSTLLLGPALSGALQKKGFAELTSVQEAVLSPSCAGRDLRITSQTGSGKTVAIGFALRELVTGPAERETAAFPVALVVTPTRELARQVEEELRWLFAGVGARVTSVTGGTSARDERRALFSGPSIVVGTPGRLLDHLTRGALDLSRTGAVVLDEADRMLEMGFREDLEAILSHAPAERRTHLVSATFPRQVKWLADKVQRDAFHIEGTRLGEANADIEHVLYLCEDAQRLDVLVNLLLSRPEDQTLIFARTRADVGGIGRELQRLGFATATLSGEMEQGDRERALGAFKRGALRVLVATDVAARGIDVQDVAWVLHVESPNDPDAYTHRSGRTGRAGRKGTSGVLVTFDELGFVKRILTQAGVRFRFDPVPSAEELRAREGERAFAELTAEDDPEHPTGAVVEPHVKALAQQLATAPDLARVFERLLTRGPSARSIAPREIIHVEPPVERPKRPLPPPGKGPRGRSQERDAPRARARGEDPRDFGIRPYGRAPATRPSERGHVGRAAPPRASYDFTPEAPTGDAAPGVHHAPHRDPRAGDEFVKFRVTWGESNGADPRRLVALVCRRGGIRGSDVGAIRVGPTDSIVEVRTERAEGFASAAARPDRRDPDVFIWPATGGSEGHRRPGSGNTASGSEGSRRPGTTAGEDDSRRPRGPFDRGQRDEAPPARRSAPRAHPSRTKATKGTATPGGHHRSSGTAPPRRFRDR